mmetsp:Transcript_18144/g.33671  ORF Transcript_18144/g.33671 Transcript_18144/m.33671 type:complete len:93 (-) Transcript_18144:139-417(-)
MKRTKASRNIAKASRDIEISTKAMETKVDFGKSNLTLENQTCLCKLASGKVEPQFGKVKLFNPDYVAKPRLCDTTQSTWPFDCAFLNAFESH